MKNGANHAICSVFHYAWLLFCRGHWGQWPLQKMFHVKHFLLYFLHIIYYTLSYGARTALIVHFLCILCKWKWNVRQQKAVYKFSFLIGSGHFFNCSPLSDFVCHGMNNFRQCPSQNRIRKLYICLFQFNIRLHFSKIVSRETIFNRFHRRKIHKCVSNLRRHNNQSPICHLCRIFWCLLWCWTVH